MTDKELKAICDYMGQPWKGVIFDSRQFDSNSAWEVVQEMERKGDLGNFYDFTYGLLLREMDFTFWLMNPCNFFRCFTKWLMSKEEV